VARAYDAVIFDLDGTLVDSAPSVRKVLNQFLDEIGLLPFDLAGTRGMIGLGVGHLLRSALAARGVAPDDARFVQYLTRFMELYEAAPAGDNAAIAGAEDALRGLRASGIRIGLCTNKPEGPTRNVIAARGWAGLFSAIVTGDSLPQKKPDPAPLIFAWSRLGTDLTRTLYVGDSEIDAQTASAAGIDFALRLGGYVLDPDQHIDGICSFYDYATLVDFVRRGARTSLARAGAWPD
jgi:phosphoglycolate phosphatase